MSTQTPSQKPQSSLSKLLSYDIDTKKYKQAIFENIVLMITSGIDILTTLESLKRENKNKSMNEILSNMITDIKSGLTLWSVMQKYGIIAEDLVNIVRIGEESGNLANNLNIVLEQQQKNKEIKSKLQSASIYPVIVMVLLFVVMGVVITFVFPKMTEIYGSLDVELPGITLFLMKVGAFMGKYGAIVTPVALGLMFGTVYYLFINAKTKRYGQALMFSIPVFSKIIKELEFVRMGYLISSLLKSGFTIVESLEILYNSTDMFYFRKLYKYMFDEVNEGERFYNIFASYPQIDRYLSLYVRQSIVTGEQTASLDKAFEKIFQTYEKENAHTTDNLTAIFEPVLLIVVWIGVAFLALAVILPIYSLVGNFSSIADAQNSGGRVEDTTPVEDAPVDTAPTTDETQTPPADQGSTTNTVKGVKIVEPLYPYGN